ncbi:MAG TPA: maleylpyruvate isomerase family mycothiol-dependent enzyme [Candidatus Limnocylindria bacterium]|nr:maleylpyruvate isomerase family mycothiol-dependent enzyme [Candidatus Limnocylindria bacterium]
MDDHSILATAREAYGLALVGVQSLAHDLSESERDLPTDCPGWSVRDHVAHVAGLEAVLMGRPRPDHDPDWSTLPHVRNDAGRFMEVDVDLRRSWSWADVLTELDEVVALRLPQVAALPDDPEASMIGPLGQPRPLLPTLPIRAFDVWQHEQDVRHALGLPGVLDGPGAQLAVRQIRSALPYVLGKQVGGPPGTTLRWTITGEQAQEVVLQIDATGRSAEVAPDALTGDPTAAITCDTETFTLLGAGRRDPAVLTVEVDGDVALAGRILAAVAITP